MFLTEATVGEVEAVAAVIVTLLSLSVNTVVPPLSVRAQPSGTFTVNPLNPWAGW